MPVSKRYFPPVDFKTRFPAIDGLRALAVTSVFLYHYGGGAHGGLLLRVFNIVRQRGGMGVELFFVISGFLITGILYDTRNDSHFFKRFFARRTVRIFPVFYLVFAVLLLLTPIFHYQWRWVHLTFLVYLGNIFGNLDFSAYGLTSANHPSANIMFDHFWSLCVEEQFYLLWPFVVWKVADRVRLLWTAVGLCVFSILLRCAALILIPMQAETWIGRTLPFRLDSLLAGAILALVLRGPAADRWQRACKWIFLVSAALVLSIFVLSPSGNSPWFLIPGLTLISTASAGLIGCTLRSGSAAYQIFYFKPLRILGKYSYGFYVFHLLWYWAFLQLLNAVAARTHSLMIAGLVALPLNFCLTFLAAKLSFDLFESRFLVLKRGFEYDSEVSQHKHAFITR